MTKIIGFDISSTTTGWCVLDVDAELKNIKYIDSGYFKPIKDGTIFDRLSHSKEQIIKILDEHKPDEVVIEDLIQFMKGHSTAKTIITLSLFNRNVGMVAYDYLEKNPTAAAQIPHINYVRDAGSEGIELVMWLIARGAMDDVAGGKPARVVHRFYHVPASNTAVGHLILENEA